MIETLGVVVGLGLVAMFIARRVPPLRDSAPYRRPFPSEDRE